MNDFASARRSHAPHVVANPWRHRGKRGRDVESMSLALESGVRVRVAGHDVAPLATPGMMPGSNYSPGFAAPFARRAAPRGPARRDTAMPLTSEPLEPAHGELRTSAEAPIARRAAVPEETFQIDRDATFDTTFDDSMNAEVDDGEGSIVGPKMLLAAATGITLAAVLIGLTLNLAGPSSIVAGAMLIMGSGLALLVASRERGIAG